MRDKTLQELREKGAATKRKTRPTTQTTTKVPFQTTNGKKQTKYVRIVTRRTSIIVREREYTYCVP